MRGQRRGDKPDGKQMRKNIFTEIKEGKEKNKKGREKINKK